MCRGYANTTCLVMNGLNTDHMAQIVIKVRVEKERDWLICVLWRNLHYSAMEHFLTIFVMLDLADMA